jgi:hypothetical protein
MSRLARIGFTVLTLSLGLALAGCEGFDPTSIVDTDFFNTKKRLPGERKAVFPEGTPGVPQGVPMELVKGNQGIEQAEQTEQAQPTAQAAQGGQQAQAQAENRSQAARGQAARGIETDRRHGSAGTNATCGTNATGPGAIAGPMA